MISTFRHALRSLMKSPGFTTVAILTLALGIGISASSFSTTNAFFLSSLPYPESDQLVRIFRTTSQTQTANFTPAAVLGLQDSITSMTDVTAYYYDLCSLSEPGQPPEQVGGISASANILTSLRVQPVLGRGFAPDDCEPGKGLGIIITDRMWKRRFAGSPDIIGRTVRINGETLSVIGVLPASFHAPLVWGGAEYLRPWIIYPGYRNKWDASWVDCFARLKPGVNLRQAQSELSTISARFAREYPKDWSIDGIHCTGFATSNMGGVNIPLFALMIGLSTAVLLVACANLASLQLARSFGRTREFAIRSSLGAGRFQLMAPLLAESMILALAGGGLGLIFTSWTNHYVGSQLNISGDRGFDIPIDAKVLVYALVVALLTGLAFGIVPAWLASRVPASDALKEGARGSTGGPSHNRIRFGLIIAEIAL